MCMQPGQTLGTTMWDLSHFQTFKPLKNRTRHTEHLIVWPHSSNRNKLRCTATTPSGHSQDKQGPDIPRPHSKSGDHQEQPLPWQALWLQAAKPSSSPENKTFLVLCSCFSLMFYCSWFVTHCVAKKPVLQHVLFVVFLLSFYPLFSPGVCIHLTNSSHTLALLRLSMKTWKWPVSLEMMILTYPWLIHGLPRPPPHPPHETVIPGFFQIYP